MPTYTWGHDDHEWEVMTSISRCEDPQDCPKCGKPGEKRSWRDAPYIDKTAAGGWNAQSYNPGLGCWTKNQKHAAQIAKSRGLVEVGNEPVDKIEKAMASQRRETAEKRWDEATKPEAIREVIG